MAETVMSVVIQDAVNQVLCSIKERYGGNSDAKGHMERMEMAHIKLEATLELSDKWKVTSVPLSRWRRKLKRAAQDCDDMLRKCRQRLHEEEETDHRLRGSSFPTRIAHTTRSLVASIFKHTSNEPSRSTVHRFEWLAEGASEFLRYAEYGGTPHQFISLNPLLQHLLAGKGTRHCFIRGNQHLSFMLRPFSHPEYGIQCRLKFFLEDSNAPENNFLLGIHLRLSDSTDIVGVIVKCLQLFTPHLRLTAETVKTKLTHLPMQDFVWVPNFSIGTQKEHWDNLQTILYQWYRPNPLCCQKHNHDDVKGHASSSISSLSESFQYDMYLEPVTVVYLQGHITLSGHNRGPPVVSGDPRPSRDFQFLKLAGIFSPHACSSDLPPTVAGSAIEMINRETLQYANISFEQLGKIMLPNAVDFFHRDDAATPYKMLWKSNHASAYVQIEDTSWRATNWKCRGRKHQKRRDKKVQGWTRGLGELMGSWAMYAPVQLQSSVADWIQKEKENEMLLLEKEKCQQTSYIHTYKDF